MRGDRATVSPGRPGRKTGFIWLLLVLLMLAAGCGARTSSDLRGTGSGTDEISLNSGSAPKGTEPGTPGYGAPSERKTAQNANLQMKARDVAAAVGQITALCEQQGGYTVSSHVYRDDEKVSAQLVTKVPRAVLGPVLEAIAAMGEVTDKSITTQDVTEEYYDSQARLKVLQAKEQRLLGLMDKAAGITEIISLENELTKTRSDIEVLSGRLQYLSNITDFSLISIRLIQGIPGTVKAPQGTWGKAWQGLIGSINGVISFCSQMVVLLFVMLPWAVLLAVLAGLGWYIRRRTGAGKKRD